MRKVSMQVIDVPSGVVEATVEATIIPLDDYEDVLSRLRGYGPDEPIPYQVVRLTDA